ncbi:MAG: 4Fe-4S dicluster domain-containing protein [Candidatus Aminicenantes bacterium]|nr:4Fe-4S dicluster domain-containing protein [Candidatus Aminicenantes bacterium]
MAKRKIIEINRDLCNGCGLCTTACAEGALELDEKGKAVLVRELFCDGMGACLSVCPTDALKVVERESEEYDPQETYKHVLKTRGAEAARNVHGLAGDGDGHGAPKAHHVPKAKPGTMACGCPSTMAQEIKRGPEEEDKTVSGRSELSQWPVQLHLVSPFAPYLKNADLLIAADCTAFALGSFHQDLLKGKKLVIACPKLDDTEGYVDKLAEIIKLNAVKSVTVAIMTVPCCSGLHHMVEDAVEKSGTKITLRKVVVGIDGKIVS